MYPDNSQASYSLGTKRTSAVCMKCQTVPLKVNGQVPRLGLIVPGMYSPLDEVCLSRISRKSSSVAVLC